MNEESVGSAEPHVAYSLNASQIGQVGDHNTAHIYFNTGMPVEWPYRIGLVPALADAYLERVDSMRVLAALSRPGNTVILTGLGGVGKTQTAIAFAQRTEADGQADLLVWVKASSRVGIAATFAQCARELTKFESPRETELQAAGRFLVWVQRLNRPWLIVLDDLRRPSDLAGLWPGGPQGRVLVTTRRDDASLYQRGRMRHKVDLYTPREALHYLKSRMPGVSDASEEASALCSELGFLPLALAQAQSYILEREINFRTYRSLFADKSRSLRELLPEDAAADDYEALRSEWIVASTWRLSIEAAEDIEPKGLARPALQLASVLSARGIPLALFRTEAARNYLTWNRSAQVRGQDDAREVSEDEGGHALHCLRRLNLVELSLDSQPSTLYVHALVQRAVREDLSSVDLEDVVWAAGDALLSSWSTNGDRTSEELWRDNTEALLTHDSDVLFVPDVHPIMMRVGESQIRGGLYLQACELHHGLLDRCSRLGAAIGPGVLSLENGLGTALSMSGRAEEGETILKRALMRCEAVLGPNDPLTFAVRLNLAESVRINGHPEIAVELIKHAQADLKENPIRAAAMFSDVMVANNFGWTLVESGALTEAVGVFERVLRDFGAQLGERDPRLLMLRHNLGVAYRDLGRVAHAVEILEETFRVRKEILGYKHPDTLTNQVNLGVSYHLLGHREEGRRLVAEVVDLAEGVVDPTHVLVNQIPMILGFMDRGLNPIEELRRARVSGRSGLTEVSDHAYALARTGKSHEAIDLLERALADTHYTAEADSLVVTTAQMNLAFAYREVGRLEEALELLERTLRVREETLGREHPRTLMSRNNLANVYSELGRLSGAIELYAENVELCTRVHGASHSNTLINQESLVRVCLQQLSGGKNLSAHEREMAVRLLNTHAHEGPRS